MNKFFEKWKKRRHNKKTKTKCFVGYEELQKQRRSEAHDNNAEEVTAQASFGKNWKDIPKSFLLLVGTI